MDEPTPRVLICDNDPDTLLTLQRVLQDSGIDVTITWHPSKVFQLLGTGRYNLILIGDRRPELDAAAILQNLSWLGTCPSVLILRTVISEPEVEHFYRLGAAGVVPITDALAVLDQVNKALLPLRSASNPNKFRLVEARPLRAA